MTVGDEISREARQTLATSRLSYYSESCSPALYDFCWLLWGHHALAAFRNPLGGLFMRIRHIAIFSAAVLAGALAGSLIGPRPAEAVARELIELQRDVTSLLQGQKDLSTQVTQDHTVMKTLVEQSSDNVNKLGATMSSLQKSVQDVQANSGTTPAPASGAATPSSSTGASPSSSAGPTAPAPSADTLYSNGLRDITSGKYDLARSEFEDYLK